MIGFIGGYLLGSILTLLLVALMSTIERDRE